MLRDKGISRYNYRVHDGKHYDRAYVKKLDEEVTFLPFSKSCTLDPWDDDYFHGESKYPRRWLEKQVGKNGREVHCRFNNLGWSDIARRDSFWKGRYSGVDDHYVENYCYRRDFYIDEEGILRRYPSIWKKDPDRLYLTTEQWLWNRDNPLPDNLFDESKNGMKKLPKKYWVGYNGKVILLTIYLFPSHPDRPGDVISYYSCWGFDFTKNGWQEKANRFKESFKAVAVRTYGGYIKDTYVSVVEAEREWKRTE